jgi:uncharacterized repeat protein (TIGR01451 family)
MITIVSEPAEVAAGPLLLAPPADVQITLTPALFITSKAFLQPPAIPQLQAVADSIEKYADAAIKVEGHTDYRPIHTRRFPSNWELGEARAKAVVDWLIDNRGIDPDRLVWESFAATRPVVLGGITSEELQPNRRTEVIIKAEDDGPVIPVPSPATGWEKSTLLLLKPVRFDAYLAPATGLAAADWENIWEVMITVENTGTVPAEDALLTDLLPEGVEFVAGSATLGGAPVAAETAANLLSLTLPSIPPSATAEVRYRIRALADQVSSGGGAASVEVKTATGEPVVQKSNEVSFR